MNKMSRYKQPFKKQKLVKAGRQTKWAPFWLIPKIFGKGVTRHPSEITAKKRSWRRTRIKL